MLHIPNSSAQTPVKISGWFDTYGDTDHDRPTEYTPIASHDLAYLPMQKKMRDSTRLNVFDVELLCDQEVYHLGESISGAIVIEPAAGQIIAKLRVGIHCQAKVQWTPGSSKTGKSRSSVHQPDTSKQIQHAVHYFDAERIVHENRRASAATGPDLVKLRNQTGRLGLLGPEEFPFVFKLPERGVPASWTGLYGSVRYWIEAVVEVCGKDCFREDIVQGVIIAPSATTLLSDPQIQAQKFPVSGMACVPTSISARLQPNQSVYLPGETVQLTVTVQNTSPWKATSRVSLVNTQVFRGKSGVQKLVKDSLVQRDGDSVRAHSDASWPAELKIPPTVCPSLLDCVIIKCHYTALLRLRVRSVIPQFFDVSVPIVVAQRSIRKTDSTDSTVPTEVDKDRHLDLFDRMKFRDEMDLTAAAETSSVK